MFSFNEIVIKINGNELVVNIFLDGRKNPLEVVLDSDRYSFMNLNDLSTDISKKLNIEPKELKVKIYASAVEMFRKKESEAPDTYQGIVALLSGKQFLMVDRERIFPKRYFSRKPSILIPSELKIKRLDELNKLRAGKENNVWVRKLIDWYKIRKIKREYIPNDEEFEKRGFLHLDFSRTQNSPDYFFVGKILAKGKKQNLFDDTYEWYIVEQVTPEEGDENNYPVHWFTLRNKCIANITPIRNNRKEMWRRKTFLRQDNLPNLLEYKFAYQFYEKGLDLGLEENGLEEFWVGKCLEELMQSYLHGKEAYLASAPWGTDRIFENEFMSYLYQMWAYPSYGVLLNMYSAAENPRLNEERLAAKQILRMYKEFKEIENPIDLGELPLSEFKEMSRVLYVNFFQKPELFEYYQDEDIPIVLN